MERQVTPLSDCPNRTCVVPDGAVTVFLADGHRVARKGVTAYLDLVDDLAVVGEAADGHHALDQITEMARRGELPHVVVISLSIPVVNGLAATRMIKMAWPHVGVVLLASFLHDDVAAAALAAGAARYLVKETTEAGDLARAIRDAACTGARCNCSSDRRPTRTGPG